ncbi:MFS transporter [Chitinophaga nivalis]|uniref:MFS transporter n=1 Tax=Chitinophaga nivalis TaxID=2991709 RepID=A0ABT3IS45_9BACT|nr:MFS transporter [Chitinophaga nivalis]MCW3463529.1 MFS transporter [Chitinophaga nivalis]MCW3486781.1 MFS transporter [Chitinophaga nivalis]
MKKRFLVLGVLCILAIITYLDRTALSVAEHGITSELHISEKEFGWLLAAFSIAYGIFQIPMGMLGDKMGVKTILLLIVLWWSVFTMLTGVAGSFMVLIIVRFLFASGEAGAFPNISIALSKWFPAVERGRAQSFIWMFTRFGGALAPVFIIPIQETWGWRYVFYTFGGIGILWAVLWWFFFRENPSQMPGITAAEIEEIESTRKIKTAGHSLPFRKILRSSNLWALMMMYFLYMFGAYFFLSWMPKYLRQGRGFDTTEMGFLSMPFILGAIGCLIGGFSCDYLSRKFGIKWGRRIIGLGGLLIAGVFMILAALTPNHMVCIILLSLGLAFKDFTLPVSWTVATDIGGKDAGAISGAMHMFGQIGSTIMSVGFGYLISSTHDWNLPIIIIGVIVICSGLLWLKIDASRPLNSSAVAEG